MVRFIQLVFFITLSCLNMVSIPLWFDSYKDANTFQQFYQKVSIPLWFDSYSKDFDKWFYADRVSIPLWFDSYLRTATPSYSKTRQSQFHYGSIHTQYKKNKLEKALGVSIPLWFDSYCNSQIFSGSYRRRVSIPLWFDSYVAPIPVYNQKKYCLNSTMVRFIR